MEASYKKLWKLLIDRDMSKTDLRLKAGISTMALAKLGKNENVSMDVLKKVCKALECNIGDIMDLVPEDEKKIKKNYKLQEQGRKMSTCRLYIE
jgi:DNA-binding Xre family transcriptional regulator